MITPTKQLKIRENIFSMVDVRNIQHASAEIYVIIFYSHTLDVQTKIDNVSYKTLWFVLKEIFQHSTDFYWEKAYSNEVNPAEDKASVI